MTDPHTVPNAFVTVDIARFDTLTAISRWEQRTIAREAADENAPAVARIQGVLPFFRWQLHLVHRLAGALRFAPAQEGHCVCMLMCEGTILFRCEDAHGQRALSTVLDWADTHGTDLTESMLFFSRPIFSQTVEQVICARIPVLVSAETPTDRAVALARQHHLNLLCSARIDSVDIFSSRGLWDEIPFK